MKVIVAGMSKTGTKSMAIALKELGMNVYDYMEHFQYCGKDWLKIYEEGGSIEDFRRMYEGVDAVADMPACHFWEELHEAFPDAKIILTMREDEDKWFKSWQTQQDNINTTALAVMRYLSPTCRSLYFHATATALAVYGVRSKRYFSIDSPNQLLYKMAYRRHNAYVLLKAPKDKLLVYSVKEGWEPLCKFLGVDVPAKPFPHKNVGGKIYDELMATNPIFIRSQRELMISVAFITLLCSYGCFKAVVSPASLPMWLESIANLVPSSLQKLAFWK